MTDDQRDVVTDDGVRLPAASSGSGSRRDRGVGAYDALNATLKGESR
ncbi:MAG: hypothetical protein ACR2G8_00100 [Candidatus Limnocylindria bacterium]